MYGKYENVPMEELVRMTPAQASFGLHGCYTIPENAKAFAVEGVECTMDEFESYLKEIDDYVDDRSEVHVLFSEEGCIFCSTKPKDYEQYAGMIGAYTALVITQKGNDTLIVIGNF